MREHADVTRLYAASAVLTGYDEMALRGTGLGPTYLETITDSLWAPQLDALLTKTLEIGRASAGPMECAEALKETILGDPETGPLARNVVILWFLGTWADTEETLETGKNPPRRTVSDRAYTEGLVWNDMGAHPQAAKWPGWCRCR